MAGPSWLVDKSRIATKIKCASGAIGKITWKSNPTKACPNCQYVIDNSDVAQEWPGLPKGVKFDPSDPEIILHLLAKVGAENLEPHPFIDEFITTLEVDDGICYTHPKHLPGVTQDGSASHFFHRAIKAYNTGSRKRRKVCSRPDCGDVRWHKTGKTKPILLNGLQKGCKKIMVLYMTSANGGKADKTNWVMHQYHLGKEDDEKDGELVISKVFYQRHQGVLETEATTAKVDPITPNSVTPEPPHNEKQCSYTDQAQGSHHIPPLDLSKVPRLDGLLDSQDDYDLAKIDQLLVETQNIEGIDDIENDDIEDSKIWWESDSENILNPQQLVEGFPLLDDLFQSHSPKRDGEHNKQPNLSLYAQLGQKHLKKDIEECQKLDLDTANNKDIEEESQNHDLDNAIVKLDSQPTEYRLSQLEFSSQDSYIAWGGTKTIN